MGSTFTIGKFFNIPVKIHGSFVLLILYVAYMVYDQKTYEPIWLTLFVFVCVVLHEYGHALMARKYGVSTEDIILFPIGGVARLQKLPEKPAQEIAIAFAGPLVNLTIALLFIIYLKVSEYYNPILVDESQWTINNMIKLGMLSNIMLFLFNLIPAFPMDGGRILRAALALKLNRAKATHIASLIGKVIAVLFIIGGIYFENYIIAIIGFFIIVSASSESREVQHIEKLAACPITGFINTNATKIHVGDKMSKLFDILCRTGEANFVVYDSLGYAVGTVPSYFITEAVRSNAQDEYVNKWMSSKLQYIEDGSNLKQVYEVLQREGVGILLVKNEIGEVVGVIDREAVTRAGSL